MKVKKILALSLSVAMLAGGVLSVSAQGLSDVFSADYYAGKYGDLKANGVTSAEALLNHAVTNGIKEGRDVSPILDVAAYRAAYADLEAAFGDNWDAYVDHYLTFGIKEGRTAGVKFDLKDYVAKNADLKAAFGDDYVALAKHYVTLGINENRQGGKIAQAATKTVSNSSNSGNSGNSNNAETSEPVVEVKYGHEHNWAAMIANGTATLVELQTPTCTKGGYAVYRCTSWVLYNRATGQWNEVAANTPGASRCSATHREEVAKLHHTVPANGAYIVDHPTCTESGTATYVCEVCGEYVKNETIPALGHVWATTKTVTAISCNEAGKGYTEQTCQRCGAKQQINVTYKHSVEKFVVTVAPTCSTPGSEEGYCSVCGEKQTREIPIIAHKSTTTANVSVDTKVGATPAHATYTVTYCPDCLAITAVTPLSVATACADGDGDGVCDVCKRPVNRTVVNAEKLYQVGEKYKYNTTIIQ